MIFDGHIHTIGGHCDAPEIFVEKAHSLGVVGGNIFTVYPEKYRECPGWDQRGEARIDWLVEYTSHTPGFLPFHFLDPTEPGALRQVEYAVAHGIKGFKIICDHFAVAEVLPVVEAIAATGRPLMFHAGVLGNATPSSQWNQPINFECLFSVAGLKFSLAHLAWPWCDELIGIYGKFELARRNSSCPRAEMYLDITPGTPGIYREIALRKLYGTGYPVRNKVFWGSDLSINSYEVDCARWWLEHDRGIFERLEADLDSGRISAWCQPPHDHLWEWALSQVYADFVTPAVN